MGRHLLRRLHPVPAVLPRLFYGRIYLWLRQRQLLSLLQWTRRAFVGGPRCFPLDMSPVPPLGDMQADVEHVHSVMYSSVRAQRAQNDTAHAVRVRVGPLTHRTVPTRLSTLGRRPRDGWIPHSDLCSMSLFFV